MWKFLKILKTEQSFDPVISLLAIYPEKAIKIKKIHTPHYSLQHFLKQPRCRSNLNTTDKRNRYEDVYTHTHTHTHTHIHTMEYYSVVKKNKIMPFAATWMDLDIIILSELSQGKRISRDI